MAVEPIQAMPDKDHCRESGSSGGCRIKRHDTVASDQLLLTYAGPPALCCRRLGRRKHDWRAALAAA